MQAHLATNQIILHLQVMQWLALLSALLPHAKLFPEMVTQTTFQDKSFVSHQSKRPRRDVHHSCAHECKDNDSMLSVSWQGSQDMEESHLHHDTDGDLPGAPDFRHDDDQVLLDGSAEARTGSLNKKMGQTSVQPETYSNLEPTKQPSKPGDIFQRPM